MGIKQLLSSAFGSKSADMSLMDTGNSFWQPFGLQRKDTRIRYTQDDPFRAYRSHELVFGCINKIADVMNDCEIIVEARQSDGTWKRKDGHLLSSLFRRPNSTQTGRDIRRLMVQSEQAMGRTIIHLNNSAAGIPVEMTVLNPNRLTPWFDRDNLTILYYNYTRSNGTIVPIYPEELIIRRRPDLLDQWHGYAPLQAALKSINSDLGMTDYVDAFFESDATPSGILKILNSTLTDTKKEALQAQWRARYSRGGSNQKGPAVLDQNADYQKLGSNLNELASSELTDRFESRICSVFGVPPILVGAHVGLQHTTANATAKSALRDFYENKISGELATYREWMTEFMLPLFEDANLVRSGNIRVNWDTSQVMFLQEDIEKVHERARQNFVAGGWTLNEFRAETGMVVEEGSPDYYLQPVKWRAVTPEQRIIEAGQALAPPSAPVDQTTIPKALDVELSGKTGQLPDSVIRENGITDEPLKKKTPYDHNGVILSREPVGVELLIDFKRIAADQDTEAQRLQKIVARIRLALIAQACDALDAIDKAGEVAHSLTLTPDPKWRKDIVKVLTDAHANGRNQVIAELNAQRSGKSLLEPVRALSELLLEVKAVGDDPTDTDWLDYLDELTDGLISRIIADISVRAINQYVLLKLLGDYVVDKLRSALEGQSEKLLELAAANTVNAAVQDGRREAGDSLSDEWAYRQWSAAMDVNTCANCEEWDGETDPPRDDMPDAPLGDCLGGSNCRCIVMYVSKDEAVRG